MCFVSFNLTKGGKVCEDIAAFFFDFQLSIFYVHIIILSYYVFIIYYFSQYYIIYYMII